MTDDASKAAPTKAPQIETDFQTRVEIALLTMAEAIVDVAEHAGYSGVKKLADQVQEILDGKLPELESDTAPKPAADEDDGE